MTNLVLVSFLSIITLPVDISILKLYIARNRSLIVDDCKCSLGSGNESAYTATMHFSYTILANPEVEPHASDTYQSKLVPDGSIDSNKCEGSTSRP